MLYHYLKKNYIVTVVILYIIASAILKAYTPINICIPCIWKTCFNFTCPACGLTGAFIALLKLNIVAAYKSNALIFIVLPAIIYFIVSDFLRYSKK